MLYSFYETVTGRSSGKTVDSGNLAGRRGFMGIVLGGFVGGMLAKFAGKAAVIRPPGAIEEGSFTSVCARCGNCIAACPDGIIYPDLGESGLEGLFTPVVRITDRYCGELCNECGKVCPSNAIKHSSLEEKQNIQIGVAEIIKPLCLCWEDRQSCMVCAGYCPYDAVETIEIDGIECPEIIADKCRGCGACQVVCPADKLAVIVRPAAQIVLDPVEVKPVDI